jgi:hypothetical protein
VFIERKPLETTVSQYHPFVFVRLFTTCPFVLNVPYFLAVPLLSKSVILIRFIEVNPAHDVDLSSYPTSRVQNLLSLSHGSARV